jgi:hypothetical protein
VPRRQRAGDEGRGALREGQVRGPDRGIERAGGSPAVRDRSQNSCEDGGILGAAGLPAHEAAGAAEAGCGHRHHRWHPGRGPKPAEEAAAHGQADLRAAQGRARLCRRHHHCEGLRGWLAAAGAGDVRAAGAPTRACAGRLRRGDRHHRRRRAQDPLLCIRPAALRCLLCRGLSGRDDGGLLRRPRPGLHVLWRRAEVDPLRQHQDRCRAHPRRRPPPADTCVQRAAIALPVPGSVRSTGQGQRQGQARGWSASRGATSWCRSRCSTALRC